MASPYIGQIIDACRVEAVLYEGAGRVVLKGRHDGVGRDFAIKLLTPKALESPLEVQRFFREAQVLARCSHPSMLAIANVGRDGDLCFMRTELIEGERLSDQLERLEKLPWRDAVTLGIALAEVLEHVHSKGLVHRDVNPRSVFLVDGELRKPKLISFSLAKQVQGGSRVSVARQIVGTPFFMSPEQAGGKQTDARSDIYSLGVTLYTMLTGVKPFNGKNLQEIVLKHFFYTPESPKTYCPDLPEPLCEALRRCLKKKKLERYQSAGALAEDLRALLV